jgi:uncharacterized protein YdiU (UPF0061 family)
MLAGRNTTDRQHKDTALATNLKLLCGIWWRKCIHWRTPLENILEKFSIDYESEYLIMMQNKLGLQDKKESDLLLVGVLVELLEKR